MRQNIVSRILLGFGFVVIGISLLVGFFLAITSGHNGFALAAVMVLFKWWAYGAMIGLAFIGLAEIVKLLQAIHDKLERSDRSVVQAVEHDEWDNGS